MLPYDIDEAVAAVCATDPGMNRLITRVGPCTLAVSSEWSPFQALVHSVIFQQISKHAGLAIQNRVWELFGGPPQPDAVAAMEVAQLRTAGLSRNKAATVHLLATHAAGGTLPGREKLLTLSDEEITTALTAFRGIGPWTVQMLLIFNLGRPDVLPVTDLGVRRGFALAHELESLPTPSELAAHGERWRPWRSVASWYLWRANDL